MEKMSKRKAILFVLIILGICSIVFTKIFINDKCSDNNKCSNDNIEDIKYTSLFNNLFKSYSTICQYTDLYGDKIESKDLDKDIVIGIAANNLELKFEKNNWKDKERFSKFQLEDEIKLLFYDEININHQDIYGCPGLIYNSINQSYYNNPNPKCLGVCDPLFIHTIEKIEKNKDKLYIYSRVIFIEEIFNENREINYYKDKEFKNKINKKLELENNILKESEDNFKYGGLYKFTFVLKNNNYAYKQTEYIK